MTQSETDAELTGLLTRYALYPDGPRVFPAWRRLVVAHQVSGKPTHDARLVAAMLVHGIDALLTFNAGHFQRFQPAIRVFAPADVAASPP
jgi:predicted nucleic acid-binding protein